MKPPKCRTCGKAHWSNVACDGGGKLPPGAAPPPKGPSRPLPQPPPIFPQHPEDTDPVPSATIEDSAPPKKIPKDGGRLQRWREKNREKNNAYQRDYMRKRRAKKKAEKEAKKTS